MNCPTVIAAHQSGQPGRTAPTLSVGEQLTLDDAIAAGERGASLSTEAAERRDPEFRTKAERAILAHLAACPGLQCDGETLVDIAKAKGAVPHSDKAFGNVLQTMSRRGLIRTVGFGLRRKGNGTAGARIWGLCQ